jgi:putative peptide zinc metalloprotease protein
MQTEAPASDLERRKQVRLRLRGDLSITPQKYEGRTYYVVKDPVSLRYYRFTEQEHFLLGLMEEGAHTLDDAQKEFEQRFRPDRLTLEDLEHFGQQLLTAGLAQNESPGVGKLLFARRRKRRRSELMQTLTNILYIKIPIFDPERLLERMVPYCRFIFTAWFGLFSVGVILAAILLVLTHFQTFRDRLPTFHEFFSFRMVAYLWAALGVVKVIHEFGHGVSCKRFGGEVHEMGFLFLCFSPAMYCNVSDAWTLPNKWHRIIISFAGIYVELMIAALATFVWWNSPAQPFVNNMALSLMVVCSVSTVVFNGNPLMRYDGYYVVSDWLEIPNLRDRSNRYLQRLVSEHCLGIEQETEPYMALWRRIMFVSYAIISWVYRWVITFFILTIIATFLKPYKLQVISNMLAIAAAASLVGWPLFRLGKSIHRRGRLPDMKPIRTTISASVLAALLLAFFLVPLPVSRVRQTGLVQVRPDVLTPVHLRVPGILEQIYVHEGQRVEKGAVLATFSSLELQQQKSAAQSEYDIRDGLVRTYSAQLQEVSDPDAIRRLQLAKTKAEGDRAEAERKLRELSEMARQGLTLIAPRAGIVMGLPLVDEIGKRIQRDQSAPFCLIGDPTKLRVLVPVTPDDYELIRANRTRQRAGGQELPVTIRVQGLGGRTWEGRLSHLPESEAKEVPAALSSRAGGPLAVRAGSSGGQMAPQNQVYLVGIDFLQSDSAICPGQLAQVKIHNEPRTLAWWTWRSLSRTFDLGLL